MSKADRRARKRENKLQGRAQRDAEAKRRKQRSGFIRGGIAAVVVIAIFAVIIVTGHKTKKSAATTTTSPTATTVKKATVAKYPAGCVATKPPRGSVKTYKAAPPMTIDVTKTYTATMTTNCGTIVIALDPKEAPKTVNSFVFLAQQHFFDGLTFHRVVPDFVVQGGDPTGRGDGGPGYTLPDEPPKAGYKAGSVAMANAGANTTGSQFFLVDSTDGAKGLGGPPYKYSILGQITTGLDVVNKMDTLAPSSGDGAPTKPLYIDKVTISES
jgi:cyclophilin family peptidyl-prolyl cis-trans isomerase